MRVSNLQQVIVLKGFFIALLMISCLSFTKSTAAIGNLSASQITQLAQSGQITKAAQALAGQSGMQFGQASSMLGNLTKLTQGGKLDLGSATSLVSGALGGQFGSGQISQVTSMLQGLQSGKANPAAIAGLVQKVAGGALPPEVGKALGTLGNLGNLTQIKSISDVFKNPAIAKSISGLLSQAGAGQVGKAIQQITQIASLAGNLSKVADVAKLAQSITSALPPEVKKIIDSVLGAGGLQKALADALGAAKPTQPTTPTTPAPKPAGGCVAECPTCSKCKPDINQHHRTIRGHVTSEFENHRTWIVTTYFLKYILPAMKMMTSEFTTNMIQQVQIIGTFFDAKHQLETQRVFQQQTAEAHKDYHPSEGMCVIGTNTKSLAASERRSNLAQAAFAQRMMQRQLSTGSNLSKGGEGTDRESRVKKFIEKFCIKTDYAEALQMLCKNSAAKKDQRNMDTDYTSAIENRLTLEVDFTQEGNNSKATDDEENLFALSANLFGNKVLPTLRNKLLAPEGITDHYYPTAYWYLDVRSIAAKRSVAQNSFAAITGMRAEGDEEVAPFLKAVLAEAGINPKDVEQRLGKKPSYFAQMEVLTKDIYQNPTFYANLYDKPVNVERKAAALQAIELIQDRDIYKSLLRSEAVLATLLETLIAQEHIRVNKNLISSTTSATTIRPGAK